MVFYFTLINNNPLPSLQNNMHLHIEKKDQNGWKRIIKMVQIYIMK